MKLKRFWFAGVAWLISAILLAVFALPAQAEELTDDSAAQAGIAVQSLAPQRLVSRPQSELAPPAPAPDDELPEASGPTDAEVMQAIGQKLRREVGELKGSFTPQTKVVIEAALFPTGRALFARVASSSGNKALDQQVLSAFRRAEPFPVPPSVREADSYQLIKLVFRPWTKPKMISKSAAKKVTRK